MTEYLALFGVLILGTAAESIHLVGRHDAAFCPSFSGRYSVRWAISLFGSTRLGFVAFGIFAAFRTTYVARGLAFSLSPDGLTNAPPSWLTLAPKAEETRWVVRFDAIARVERIERDILVDGRRLIRCAFGAQAQRLLETIAAMRAANPNERPIILRRWLTLGFDAKEARERIERYRSVGSWFRVANLVLTLHLFAILPLGIWLRGGTGQHVVLLGVALGVLMLCHAFLFARVVRTLSPGSLSEIWPQLLAVTLYPPAAVRARDVVGCLLLGSFHPLAVAACLLDTSGYQRFAQRCLADLAFPVAPPSNADETSRNIESWFRNEVRALAEGAIRDASLDPSAMVAAPARLEDQSQAYCPRCRTESLRTEGECPDCSGVVLVPFGPIAS